jgi:hypothetical protein
VESGLYRGQNSKRIKIFPIQNQNGLKERFFSVSHIQKIILNGVFSDPISVNHPKN